jgi:lipopolysaccharide transport system permease protein
VSSRKSPELLTAVTYSPAPDVRSPAQLARSMLRDLIASRELAWRLTVRDISAQYRQSLLGIFWAFLPPLVSASLFIFLQHNRVLNIPDPGMPYALFVLVGTVLWQTFTEAVQAPVRLVNAAKPVLAKINFPREALILSALYQTLFAFAIKAVLLIGVLAFFKVPLGWHTVLAAIPILMLMWLGIVIGVMLTPGGALLNDVQSMVTLALQLGFFLTPVIYPPPQSLPYSLLASWNPVSPYLVAARSLLAGAAIDNVIPLLVVTALLVLGTVMGWVFYRVSMPVIIERMSA